MIRWLVVLLLLLPAAPVWAISQRCAELGDACLCEEPVDTPTASDPDGNSPLYANWDPDDTTTKGCAYDNNPAITWSNQNFCGYGPSQNCFFGEPADPGGPVPYQGAGMPSTATVDYVLRYSGTTKFEFDLNPEIDTSVARGSASAGSQTHCIRGYQRWDDWMTTQGNIGANQQKILTLGGQWGDCSPQANGCQGPIQISMSDAGGNIKTRWDGYGGCGAWGCGGPGRDEEVDRSSDWRATLATVGNGDCRDHWCRFEICFDAKVNDYGEARFRIAKLKPGGTEITTHVHYGQRIRSNWNIYNCSACGWANWRADESWTRNTPTSPQSYLSHYIHTVTPFEDSDGDGLGDFWPGAACEIEGGCDQEARCRDLGDACVCNETLDSPEGSLAGELDRFWDPSNSASKECDGEAGSGQFVTMNESWNTTQQSRTVRAADSEQPFPSGANPYVYDGPLSGIHHAYADAVYGLDEETLCFRAYRTYSPGTRWIGGAANQRIKSLQIGHWNPATHANIEAGIGSSGNQAFAKVDVVDTRYNMDGLLSSSADDDHFVTCADDGWCRLEWCADQEGSTITFRAYITPLGGSQAGVTQTWEFGKKGDSGPYVGSGPSGPCSGSCGTGPASIDYDLNSVHMFVQNGPVVGPGRQYASHVMLARVPLNRAFTIGPAIEIEGGSPPFTATASAPGSVNEGNNYLVTCSTVNGVAPITYEFECDDDGDYADAATCVGGATDQCLCPGFLVGGDTQINVGCRATDAASNVSSDLTPVTIVDVPTATFAVLAGAPASAPENSSFTVTCTPSNESAPVSYTFECGVGALDYADSCLNNPQPNECLCPGIDVASDMIYAVGCEGTDAASSVANDTADITIQDVPPDVSPGLIYRGIGDAFPPRAVEVLQ